MDFSATYTGRAQNSILSIYHLDTGETTQVAQFDKVIEAPMWSKDSEDLYYNCEGLIYKLHLADKTISKVPTGRVLYCNNDHVLAPDMSAIAVSGNVENTIESKIYIVSFATGQEREVVSAPWSYLHGWSPDGERLLYCAARQYDADIEWDIYSCPAAGGPETRLTDAPGLNDGCEYSADGAFVWFHSMRTGLMQIWRMNTDGTEQTQMTFDDDVNAWFPHISPDMQKVVYLTYHKGDLQPGEHLPDKQVEIRMISASGGKPTTLLSLFGGQGTINVNSWAPDSKRFAFVSYVP